MSEPLPLSALLSRALVAFTIELDNAWESRTPQRTTRFGGPRGAVYATSLVCWSNFMRAVPSQGVPVAELERRVRARSVYHDRPTGLEAGWRRRAGDAPVGRLRAALEAIVAAPAGQRAPIWRGLDAPPGTWRSRIAAPDVLPDFPMPRQSGHPDGA